MKPNHIFKQTGKRQLPQCLIEMRSKALQSLNEGKLPDLLDEAWRFGDRKQANIADFNYAAETTCPEIASLCENSLKIIVLNNRIAAMPDPLPPGLIISALSDTSNFNLPVCGEGSYFHLVHNACVQEGIIIKTEPGAVIQPVIEVIHAVAGNQAAIFPHTYIKLAENSKLQIMERHISMDSNNHLCVAKQQIDAGPNASADYVLLQQLNPVSRAVELQNIYQQENSRLNHFVSHIGAIWARQELKTSLLGRNAHAEILSANAANGNRIIDQRTFQDHQSPNCLSNLIYKNVLDDKAKTVFSGMIKVEPGAHETDAYQSNKNLMLSDTAEANSMPGLEILADHVKCSHGSAISAIEPDEIFYLGSRGIHPKKAEQLISKGFLMQVLEKMESDEMVKAIESAIF